MYELKPGLDKISKARIYYSQLNLLGEIVFELIMKRDTKKVEKLKKLANNLIEIFQFCELGIYEIELVDAVINELLVNPINVSPIDLNNIYEIINICKLELKNYVREQTTERFTELAREQFSEYVNDLKKQIFRDLQLDKERRKEEIVRLIYTFPGHYIKSLYTLLNKKYVDISYSAVWKYINELEKEEKIITIGGPQGRYRYCFPNPKMVKNRAIYYGKYFGISGVVEEAILERFKTPELRGPFFNIYFINSNIQPLLLILPYGVSILTLKDSIKAYGRLESYSYLENLGYFVENEELRLDVLLGWKVAAIREGKEVEIWIDEKKAVIEPEC